MLLPINFSVNLVDLVDDVMSQLKFTDGAFMPTDPNQPPHQAVKPMDTDDRFTTTVGIKKGLCVNLTL